MCGIVGSINFHLNEKAVKSIRHRGPDGFGSQEIELGSHKVQLFHHRLSIVDLSENGRQPMSTSDGKGFITFNGEIYNHTDLRAKMEGVLFRGHSDTETLVNLCRRGCSQESLMMLNGIFAFAYLDVQEKKLYLARDRFGVKPLYYFLDGEQLIFSSELRSILEVVQQPLLVGSITTSLEIRHVPAPATLYKNIFKVEPGQVVVFGLEESLSISKSYFSDLPKQSNSQGTLKQIVTEYGQLLERAVERQLMSDVEVGILLSGGVDSSLVAAIAKSKVDKVKAFTVGFDDKELDERANAKATADFLKLDHYTAEVKFSNFLSEFEELVRIVEEPVDSGSFFSMYTLSKLASSKVKVVLSGQGADEPLGGYTKYKALPMIDFLTKASLSPDVFRLCSKYIRHKNLSRVLRCVGNSNDLHAYFEFNSLLGSHLILQLLNKNVLKQVASEHGAALGSYHDILKQKENLPAQRSSLFPYLDTRTKLPETLLNYTDKITMHFGLECRVPMLDNDLVAFIESIPRKYKFGFKSGKLIHKEFAKEYLPEDMINRKKLAFHGPTKSDIRQKSAEIKQWINQNDNQLFWELFDKSKILAMVDAHRVDGSKEKELILLMSLLVLTNNNSCVKKDSVAFKQTSVI
ncbi:MAG TPA: asparagine synthase (glutamine-hydrolyzing) [Flavisolibacter sp.]|nr:asparagine synthase (glutamine-hydrolyzing) [Flavisolibacter sp.]